jgi:hypothetical protein
MYFIKYSHVLSWIYSVAVLLIANECFEIKDKK